MTAKKANEPKTDESLPPFEPSLAQLEQIIDAIESGDVTLEQSLDQYARGMKLIKHCRSILDRAESKIKQLTIDEQGEITEQNNQ
ncbi:exodeoxyribonuclease VII small subunit [Planctomycetales bacterium ZRK34]|nr:exodeoxyribonuclease VII small subunit [Planctomycetales bacterium ZRK34]